MNFSEKELIDRFKFYASSFEEQLFLGSTIEEVLDEIPLITVVSNPADIHLTHTNKLHEELTGYSAEEVRESTINYLQDIVHPQSLQNVKQFLPEFYRNSNSNKTLSFIQYVRLYGAKQYSPLITFAKSPRFTNAPVARLSVEPHKMGKVRKKIERIIEMDQFKLKNFSKFQQLTGRELDLLKLLAHGYNNSDIANKLFISRQTVETHRKSLKAKLGLQSYSDIMRWALAFDLVKL